MGIPNGLLGGLTHRFRGPGPLTHTVVRFALHVGLDRQVGVHEDQLLIWQITRELVREPAELEAQVIEGVQIGARPQDAFPASITSAS